MTKVASLAVGLGVFAGALTISGDYAQSLGYRCPGGITGTCAHSSLTGVLLLSVSVLLVFDSLLGLVGPRKVFYLSAALSGLAAVVVLASSDTTPFVLATVGVEAASLVVSIVAARRQSRVSEQSNPMNLPVFG